MTPDPTPDCELLIIGSGFGGAIAAQRLTDAGHRIVMLERGPWRDTVPTRSMGVAPRAPLPQGRRLLTHGFRAVHMPLFNRKGLGINKRGFFEAFLGKGLWLLCTSSVGGGSHAYAGLQGRPLKPDYWSGHHPDVSQDRMEPYYDEIIARFGSRPVEPADQVPNHMTQGDGSGPLVTDGLPRPAIGILLPQTAGAPRKLTNALGVERWEAALDNDTFLGSPSGAKTTLDFAFLWPAMQKGLDLRDLCEVQSIHALADSGAGPRYEVRYRDLKNKHNRVQRARHVIVAAGALNTVRLLLRSRDVAGGLTGMPNLGQGVGGNGDYFAFWKEGSAADLTRGLPGSGGFKVRDSKYGDEYMERAALLGLENYPLPKRLKRWLRHQSTIIAYGKDEANGQIRCKNGRFLLRYDRNENPGYDEVDGWIAELEAATASKVYGLRTPISIHPLGGARLGADAEHGVIDANGEVYGHPGLYVADAAALPQAPGGAPSMTISAWSAHVADRLIAQLA